MRERDMPAYPHQIPQHIRIDGQITTTVNCNTHPGMTKLELTAKDAMCAMLVNQSVDPDDGYLSEKALVYANDLWDELEEQSCGN